MELRVHKVRQMSSGASYVAIYEADVELCPAEAGVTVEVLRTQPSDADAGAVAEAREAIRSGAEWVLRPRGLGAVIRVQRVVVHPVDFSPARYEMLTSEALLQVLPQDAEPGAAADGPRL
ncbi:hypothetical protein [Urbifossiella limnaea]|uniref:Uncharacterized protein n=1 Tax=Urbifossiella limnaea TaxID=2528023 RepID=A0A517XQR5_9BACT|nr:hypothetical protein [Urbifossiella limnaea]QDU19846.1 hypothetical protein ETAA1_17840 [Urbifossiella limnaea]